MIGRLKSRIHNFFQMWPLIRKHGLKYYYNRKYRRKCQNRIRRERDLELYGSYFLNNKRKIRKKLLQKRDGRKCQWCFKKNNSAQMTIDHIMPVSEKKKMSYKESRKLNKLGNMRLICRRCHEDRNYATDKGYLKL